jgi:hypothetical protein
VVSLSGRVVAAPASGHGQTTLAAGPMAALLRHGGARGAGHPGAAGHRPAEASHGR